MVYVEKPFINKNLSKREINDKFYKKSMNVTLVKDFTRSNRKMANQRPLKFNETPNPEKFETNEISLNYDLINELDSFGCSVPHEKKIEKETPKLDESSAHLKNEDNIQGSSSKRIKLDVEEVVPEKTPGLVIGCKMIADYSDSDREENLVIDTGAVYEAKNMVADNGPASPSQSEPETHEIVAKVIPLEKEVSKNSSVGTAESQNKPSLFEMMLKVQNKLKTNVEADHTHLFSSQPSQSKLNTISFISVSKNFQLLNLKDQQMENPNEYKNIDNIHNNINYSLWTLDNDVKLLIRWSYDGVVLNENNIRKVRRASS